MPAQVDYYNRFALDNKASILSCPEPHLWTTDYAEKGRVYREMKERVAVQEKFVASYFTSRGPVLDIGCGFGRQAFLLASKGFAVTGTDTSSAFVNIAQDLFELHGLPGAFFCTDVITQRLEQRFSQVLLLDVLEHIPPSQRNLFVRKVYGLMKPQGVLLLSLPHVKKRLSSQLNNKLRKRLTQHLSWFRNLEEHPYPIPQPREMQQLVKERFMLLEFSESPESDYYVLQRQ